MGPKIAAMATFKTQLKNLRQKKEEEDKEAAPAETSSEVIVMIDLNFITLSRQACLGKDHDWVG